MCSLVVGTGDRFKSLLAGSIPDLELDGFPLEIKGSDLEIHSNCGQEALVEDIIGET